MADSAFAASKGGPDLLIESVRVDLARSSSNARVRQTGNKFLAAPTAEVVVELPTAQAELAKISGMPANAIASTLNADGTAETRNAYLRADPVVSGRWRDRSRSSPSDAGVSSRAFSMDRSSVPVCSACFTLIGSSRPSACRKSDRSRRAAQTRAIRELFRVHSLYQGRPSTTAARRRSKIADGRCRSAL
ncbi:hypothetical protein [Roseateles saccharophilus]|uniref:Uncharacterized protein n=1 Tax=Roseateles saccharophilus TaxID=304 RepID=A0A4V2VQA2_ROSSA|nr:hypothetical protein [Roseateles saccharophilus]MDG0833369.1 hypothetical protein [Roseateles saccharophilus]TCU93819.1 hypothetical protein EV671_101879 [Roseateles saccharophilus]